MQHSGKKGEKKGYYNLFLNSVKTLKENLVILAPDIAMAIFVIVLFGLLVVLNGFTSLFSSIATTPQTVWNTTIQNYFSNYRGNSFVLWKFLVSILAAFILAVIAGLRLVCAKYELIKAVVNKQKPMIMDCYKKGKKYFWKVLLANVLIFLMFAAAFAVILLIGIPIGSLFHSTIGKIIVFVIALLLIVFAWLALRAYLLFVYPILFLEENKNAFSAIKESLKMFSSNKKYVLSIFGIIILVSIVWTVVSTLFNLLAGFVESVGLNVFTILVVAIVLITRMLIELVVKNWEDVFLFLGYKR